MQERGRRLPVRVLLATEWRGTSIWPGVVVRAVVGRVDNNGVFADAQLVDQIENLANVTVVLNHTIMVFISVWARNAGILFLHVGTEVHAGSIPPHEERLT